jgi:hypothetical protein
LSQPLNFGQIRQSAIYSIQVFALPRPEENMKRWLATAGFLFAIAAPICSNAMDDITTADAIAIRETVESQLQALSHDDAAAAFQLATPKQRMMLGSPARFLNIIKEHYPPIYRYESAIFFRAEVVDGDPIQIVRLADDEGKVWIAVFRMQQEDDSSWKIDGCFLFETSSIST